MIKFKRNLIVLGLALSLIPLSGCNTGSRSVQPQVTPLPQQEGIQRNNIQNTAPRMINTQLASNQRKAENIRRNVEKLKEVQNVSVIVVGNTALVGYKPATAAGDMNATNKKIQQKCMSADKNITNVMSTQSADIVNRITKLSTDITTNNTPINNITDEFNRIIRSINPAAAPIT